MLKCTNCGKDLVDGKTHTEPAKFRYTCEKEPTPQPPAMPDVIWACLNKGETSHGQWSKWNTAGCTSYTRTDLITLRAKLAAERMHHEYSQEWIRGVRDNPQIQDSSKLQFESFFRQAEARRKELTAIIVEAMQGAK